MTRSLRSDGPGRWRRAAVVVVAPLLLLAGCGDDDPTAAPDSTATPVPTATPSATATPDDGGTAPDDPTTTPTDPSPSPTDAASSPDGAVGGGDLPGEPWEGFAAAGDVLMVIGVAHDDVLNVRAVPGVGGDVVATAAPTATDLVATGRGRVLPSTSWYEVTVDGVTGWASARFLAFPGPVDDHTAAYLAEHDRPSAETMLELGTIVADDLASEDPPSVIVASVAPSVGDLGEVVMDVVGVGDDSIRGFRVHVFAVPDEGGEGFTLRTVELWTFCGRGVTDDTGICV